MRIGGSLGNAGGIDCGGGAFGIAGDGCEGIGEIGGVPGKGTALGGATVGGEGAEGATVPGI